MLPSLSMDAETEGAQKCNAILDVSTLNIDPLDVSRSEQLELLHSQSVME